MKNKFAIISFLMFALYMSFGLAFSFLGMIGITPFSWFNALVIFAPLVVLAFIFVYAITSRIDTLDIVRRRLIGLYIAGVAALLWVVSPIEDFLILRISGGAIATDVFFYLWESLILGGAGIVVFLHWFKPINEFLRDYQSNIKDITQEKIARISNAVARFPLNTAIASGTLTFISYVIGIGGFLLWYNAVSVSLITSNLLIGAAFGALMFSLIYFTSRRILKTVADLLYIFGDVTKPKQTLGLRSKIYMLSALPGVFFVSTAIALFINFANKGDIHLFYVGLIINSFITFGFSTTMGKSLIDGILESMDEVKHGMELLESGNWTHRVNVKTGDEVEDMAYEFNKMAKELEKRCK